MFAHQHRIRDGEQHERRAAVDHLQPQSGQRGRHRGAQAREFPGTGLRLGDRPGSQQAAIASSCRVPSAQGGRRVSRRASTSGEPSA